MFYSSNAQAVEEKTIQPPEKPGICDELKSESEAWYDVTYTYLSASFCRPAVWFDNFFSDERIDEEFHPGTRVRWQHDFVNTEGQGFDYATKISASFRLPKAKKSINLIFEGEEEESLPEVVPDNEKEVRGNLGLLYEVKESARANLSLRIKLSPSVTLRYRYRYPISDTFITRFTQEIFRKDSNNGATSRLDFEKTLDEGLLLRQSSSFTIAEDIDGKEWDASLVLYHRLSDVSALSYESGVSGLTEPENYINNARLGVRYRRNFYRKWLFYELAPAVTWPRQLPADERKNQWEFLFRLEVNFVSL